MKHIFHIWIFHICTYIIFLYGTARLDLPWKRAKKVVPRGCRDEHYLCSHSPPARVSLPFRPHVEIEKAWKNPFSSRIHRFQHNSYANIEGLCKYGYVKMPPFEEILACYLSMGETSSLKVSSLLSKPLQDTSYLNGRGRTWQQVTLQPRCTPWWCFRLSMLISLKTLIKVRVYPLMRWLSCVEPQISLSVPVSRLPLQLVYTGWPRWLRRCICG